MVCNIWFILWGKLVVLDKSVVVEELGVFFGFVGSDVILGIGELVMVGLSGFLFLVVFRYNLVKFFGVFEDGSELGIVVESIFMKGSVEVLKIGMDGEFVKLGWDGGGCKKCGKESFGVYGGDEERVSMWRLIVRDWFEEF